ncbi:hypothetical protein JAAARDRAFT_167310 [Jaapia argillacea MUCL 33604]|uniref:Uncharacterized protein n=1 Tax=Jaapia argillacea MUCL 33604 TaxID=933084 RepID=A0A067QCM7_9AGAM|nr:hypothetical protein JAAARDRAFT_167310 [Jaapia argillacea MUCL 33604]
MPRLLPRLLARLADSPPKSPQTKRLPPKSKRLSLYEPPSSDPISYSYLQEDRASPRTQSILVDEGNPIIRAKELKRHKRLPPRVRFTKWPTRDVGGDEPREMSMEQRARWANPYLRMLSSPLRQCVYTSRLQPADLLIRLGPIKMPQSRHSRSAKSIRTTLVPDGLEHPKFRARRYGIARYVVCNKAIFNEVVFEQPLKRRPSPNLSIHTLLTAQVSHLLRIRILQELELLTARLACRPLTSLSHPVIRRLTRAEFKQLQEGDGSGLAGSVLVIICPPVNKDKKTGERVKPSDSALPAPDILNQDEAQPSHEGPLMPVSTLRPTSSLDAENEVTDDLPDLLPHPQIPLYNSISLFPLAAQRASLHEKLCKLLEVERNARWRERGTSPSDDDTPLEKSATKHPRVKGDQKPSHAFVVYSTPDTLLRADTVPLAIALWRMRIWEGEVPSIDWDGVEERGFDGVGANVSGIGRGGWEVEEKVSTSGLPLHAVPATSHSVTRRIRRQ